MIGEDQGVATGRLASRADPDAAHPGAGAEEALRPRRMARERFGHQVEWRAGEEQED